MIIILHFIDIQPPFAFNGIGCCLFIGTQYTEQFSRCTSRGDHISIDELSVTWRDIAKAFQFIRRTDDDNLMEPRPPSTVHLWLLGRGIMFFFYW